ncbi:MAG: NADPH:quinone oxidoreductase family protein [Xanthomonadales bacterium]|nr:NADPH:quinone oxidoreductase family protein [Xanthomonadales bacterium]
MRALLCKEFGPAEKLVLADVAELRPGAGEVLIDNYAAGLNFPDTLAIAGTYQFRPELPFIPGSEAAGVVLDVGEGVDEFRPGDRVISSGICGAFAEQQCKPVSEVIALPDTMPFATGAGFAIAYGTSYYALKQCAKLQAGETLLVLGAAGGVGLAAVDIGLAMGATVIAAASSEEKLNVACADGRALRLNYSERSLKDEVKALTGGKGADVVYDPVGGDLSEQALRATAWGGRFLVVGFASGTIPRIPLNLTLLKNNAIMGVFYGAWAQREPATYRRNMAELFALFEAQKLHPLVSQEFKLEQYREAFSVLTDRRAKGKIIFNLKN